MIHAVLHDAKDTVAVAVVEGVTAGTELNAWIMDEDKIIHVRASQDIPIGHKVAMKDMAVGDTVYNDADASGTQNGSESGIAGLGVTLSRGGNVVATTTTNATGQYSFTGLVPGTYVITVATPANFTPTGPKTSPDTVTLAAGQTDNAQDFGFVQSNGSIGDTVYVDANGNGVQDGGEAAYAAGATVTLSKNGTPA